MPSKFTKVWNILEKRNKKKVFVALVASFLSSILDLIGVASILPFLSVLADPKIVNDNIYFIKLNH